MPIETNLNVSPYFDDFSESKGFYKVLFKPTVSVQVREMNQLQSILQNQIERFGDNILKKGTIIEGCSFIFNNAQPYVKLLDNDVDDNAVIPSLYVGNFVRNSANLRAYIVNSADGFETTDPDLNTIYVNYINSGDSTNATSFTIGENLTVFDAKVSIQSVDVNTGGTGFSNSDSVVFTSRLAVTVTSGSYSIGDYVVDTSPGAVGNLEITAVDSTTLVSLGMTLLTVKPRPSDLANSSANSSNFTIPIDATISNPSSSVTGTIAAIYGSGAQARIVTNAAGSITSVIVQARGENYEYAPIVSVRSIGNATGINQVSLTAKNFIAQVQAAGGADAVGNGYTFSIKSGITYQKGYFQRVEPQTVIVSRYSSAPNSIVVGFATREDIINSNEDTSLLDNALGTENETAPGADRLKLTPELVVVDKDEAAANVEFFPLVEWNDGNPFKQNQVTVYNRIGEEIARSNYDSTGNFVMDQFQVVTQSTGNSQNEGVYYRITVDPGQAYIGGNRVQTLANYQIDVRKGLDTKVSNNNISLNYGNYTYINEVGGNFNFGIGDTVDLYDTTKKFLSTSAAFSIGNTDPAGTKIGTSRIRSLVHDRNDPGTSAAQYKLYLFDIQMLGGRNFDSVKSLHYNGTVKGIADAVLDNGIARVFGTKEDGLIFPSGVESLKNSNNTIYSYRTIEQVQTANTGTISKSVSALANTKFATQGELSSSQLRELYVVPTANDLISYNTLTGNVSTSTTSNVLAGVSSSTFQADLVVGDYIQVDTGAGTEIKRVTNISNNSSLQVDSVFLSANAQARYYRAFPKSVPIPFGYRSGLTANVDSNRQTLALDFNHSNGAQITFAGSVSVNTHLGYTVRREGVDSDGKIATRNRFIKIVVANNVSGTQGPWSIGVPDSFRLRNVYIANTSTVNTASPNVTDRFYLDHNQTSNYLGLGYLYINPTSRFQIETSDHLLVEFDYFVRSGDGYFDTVSYLGTSDAVAIANLDSTPLANLGSSATSFEVPEVYTYNNEYYDLTNQLDFRPSVANTVDPSTTVASAPINPSETESFSATEKYFPVPDGFCSTTIEQYLGRVDDVYIGEKSNIYVLKGIPDVDPRKRHKSNHPKDSLKLQMIYVPPYPSVSQILSDNIAEILNTKIANEKTLNLRVKNKTTLPIMTTTAQQMSQPMVYTMEDIGNLERRIKDLEYYVSLSVLETNITNKIIPSSLDPTLNRFKFGFFADDFSTSIYSDLDNPQYAASTEVEGDVDYGVFGSPLDETPLAVEKSNPISTGLITPTPMTQKRTNRIVPPKHIWSLDHESDNLTYYDELVITQLNATQTANVCVPNVITTNTTSNTLSYGYFYSQQLSSSGKESKTDVVTFGSLAGEATLYFYNYGAADRIRIYQGNTIITSTDQSANLVVNLTTSDKSFLSTSSVAKAWYNLTRVPDLNKAFKRGTGSFVDFVKDAGKIVFNHNPTNGTKYTIVVDKGSGSVIWKYLIKYPSTESVTTSTTVDVNACKPVIPPSPTYQGTLKVRGIQAWSCSAQFRINKNSYTAFVVDCTGLKPNSIHKFYLDGVDQAQNVAPRKFGSGTSGNTNSPGFRFSQKTLGRPLVTDNQGKISFTVYVPIKILPFIINQLGLTGGIYGNKKSTQGSSGYSTLEVRDTSSIARLVVANRTPDKVLPHDPNGNP